MKLEKKVVIGIDLTAKLEKTYRPSGLKRQSNEDMLVLNGPGHLGKCHM